MSLVRRFIGNNARTLIEEELMHFPSAIEINTNGVQTIRDLAQSTAETGVQAIVVWDLHKLQPQYLNSFEALALKTKEARPELEIFLHSLYFLPLNHCPQQVFEIERKKKDNTPVSSPEFLRALASKKAGTLEDYFTYKTEEDCQKDLLLFLETLLKNITKNSNQVLCGKHTEALSASNPFYFDLWLSVHKLVSQANNQAISYKQASALFIDQLKQIDFIS